jgi:hypothetical protein
MCECTTNVVNPNDIRLNNIMEQTTKTFVECGSFKLNHCVLIKDYKDFETLTDSTFNFYNEQIETLDDINDTKEFLNHLITEVIDVASKFDESVIYEFIGYLESLNKDKEEDVDTTIKLVDSLFAYYKNFGKYTLYLTDKDLKFVWKNSDDKFNTLYENTVSKLCEDYANLKAFKEIKLGEDIDKIFKELAPDWKGCKTKTAQADLIKKAKQRLKVDLGIDARSDNRASDVYVENKLIEFSR